MNFLPRMKKMMMKMLPLLSLLLTLLPVTATGEDFFKDVELDRFIEQEKERVERIQKKVIAKGEPVRFVALIKRQPEAKKMTYVYTAMQAAGVSPLPDVEHRMFIETVEKRIISVYVEKMAAQRLMEKLKVGTKVQFLAYHVYSYDKGPALLIVDSIAVK